MRVRATFHLQLLPAFSRSRCMAYPMLECVAAAVRSASAAAEPTRGDVRRRAVVRHRAPSAYSPQKRSDAVCSIAAPASNHAPLSTYRAVGEELLRDGASMVDARVTNAVGPSGPSVLAIVQQFAKVSLPRSAGGRNNGPVHDRKSGIFVSGATPALICEIDRRISVRQAFRNNPNAEAICAKIDECPKNFYPAATCQKADRRVTQIHCTKY
jgi:hypothetical protein